MILQSTSQDSSKSQTVSKQDMMQASATSKQMEAVLLKNMGSTNETRVPTGRKTDIAGTLLSRDYKGLSNYESNGAIEWK